MSGHESPPPDVTELAETIVNASEDGILVLDRDGTILLGNSAAGALLGRGSVELAGQPFVAISSGVDPLRSTTIHVGQPDGGTRPIELLSSGAVWRGTPVTVLTLRRETVRDEPERGAPWFRAALEATDHAIQLADHRGIVEWVNETFSRTTGYSDAEVRGRHLAEVAGMLGQEEAFDRHLRERLDRGEGWQGELFARRKDGTGFREKRTMVPVATASGEISHVVSMSADVTDRVAAERHRERLLSIVEATPNLIGMCDPDGRVIFVNGAGRRLLGLSPPDPLPELYVTDIHPEWAQEIIQKEGMPTALREGTWSGETAFLLPGGGEEIPVWQAIIVHRSPEGELEYISTVIRDLSRWKRVEEALRERVKELKALYGTSRELSRSDLPLEKRLERLVHLLPAAWLHSEITEARIRLGDQTYATEGFAITPWVMTSSILSQGQRVGKVEVALLEERPGQEGGEGPFLREERELLDSVAVDIGDAVERERLQAEFAHVQKMQTVGRLAGGAAHDFNNLLAVIQGHSEIILESLPPDSPLQADLAQVLKAARRGASLTSQLLAFSRKQVLEEEILDLRDVVVGVEPMLRRLVPERVELRVDPGEEPRPVKLDPAQLDQVILNLVVNAVDAIEAEGSVILRAGTFHMSEEQSRSLPWRPEPGDYARLMVADDGGGIPPEVAARMFEPFFTTKPEGRGTGLGMSMAYGFVKQSHGHLLVDTAPGEGTTIDLLFPLADTAARSVRQKRGPERKPDPATILLVEDDPSVRSVLKRILARAGHTVVEAENGVEAIAFAGGDPRTLDLVLTDVVMPQMGGLKLMEQLRSIRPDLPIVLMSGYSEQELTDDIWRQAKGYLRKPFSQADVTAVLRDALP